MQVISASAIAASNTQAQETNSLLAQSTLYTTKVGGQNYTANINQSSGEYVATVPKLPSVTASGLSLLLAENNVYNHISLLV